MLAELALIAGTTWHWQIDGYPPVPPKEQVIDLDLFDVPESKIREYRDAGKTVICYFSGGSYEAWRPDASKIPKSARGKKMSGWDELWINVRDTGVRSTMASRMELAAKKGCHGVEIDNVDGYANITGFKVTKNDSLNFLKYLSSKAHDLKLIIGLKNSPELVTNLVLHFDFAVVEECSKYNECDKYEPFTRANRAVFQAEYSKFSQKVCDASKKRKFSLTFFTLGTNLNGKGMVQCR